MELRWQVAELVGVPSLRRRLLAASSMDLGVASSTESFGQSESLTTRCVAVATAHCTSKGQVK